VSDTSYCVPQWKQLSIAALAERNPAKVPERLAAARSAVLQQVEGTMSQSSSNQEILRNALVALGVLRQIVQRKVAQRETSQHEIVEDRKTGTC